MFSTTGTASNTNGRSLRPYGVMDVEGHPPYASDGVYVDHRDPAVEQAAYELRDRLLRENEGASQATLEPLAVAFGLRHWRDAYNTVRNVGRRAGAGTGNESGRDSDGELRWRRWNAPRNMRQTQGAAPARQGSRGDSSLVVRRFGVEIEFNRGTGGYGQREAIVEEMTALGINAVVEHYNHTTRPHWKMTTDATVTGGELVSPIMAGDTASLDETRDAIRAVKNGGGATGRSVGMHVHHDVTDFTTAAMRERLIDALQASEVAMSKFIPPSRANGSTSCGAAMMSTGEWARVRNAVGSITPGSNPNGYHDSGSSVTRYRFWNVEGPMRKYGSIEARGLGGTLHAGKVRVWVRMGQAIVEAARQGVTLPANATPQELVDTLRTANLIGSRTGSRFVGECQRRSSVI